MKVLVAIDHSKYSERAIEETMERQWWRDTSFLVLHVISMPESTSWQDWGLKVEDGLKQELRRTALNLVSENVARLKARLGNTMTVEGQILEGHTIKNIVKAAKDWGADLIVVGSHRRTQVERFSLGSVAGGVLEQTPCSVEIVKFPVQNKSKVQKEKAVAARA